MRRNGFTLVEVLVILAILAALAAILVPTVANQVRKADVGRVVGDLDNLRTGVEAFLVNVHRYPGDAHDLGTPISGTDTDINGATYPVGLISRWEGPYVDRVVSDGGSFETGFGATIQDNFTKTEYPAASGVNYLTVRVHDLALPEFTTIDEAIDDGDGAAAGRLRHFTPGDSAHYLALPIN